jgi:hypothetical protein
MGIKIGLSNEQFGLMPKALKRAGDSIVSLGATGADGQKKLMGMLAVTNQQREAFQRLGVNQEDLMGYQSDYVALQKASGVQITAKMKQDGSLQKASLEYTSNLLQLSAISGKSVDEAAAMQKQAQAAYEIQIDNARITREIKQAELEGNTERVKQLEGERDARNKMLNVVADIGDADITSGMQKFLATGAITEQSAAFAQMGIDMQGFRKRMQDGEDVSAEFAQALKDGITRKQEEVGTAAAYNKEVGKVFGLTEKTMSWAAARADVDEKKAREEAAKGVGKPAEEKTGKTSEEDPAQIARNKMTTATIEVNRALESMLLAANPLMSGFNALTLAVTALTAAAGLAAIALGAIAAKNALGTLGDMATGPGTGGKGGAGKGGAGKGVGKALSTLGKMAGPAAGLLAVGAGAMNATEGYNNAEEQVKKGEITKEEGTVKKSEAVGKGIGEGLGGASGAMLGAAIGTAVFPVIGTAIGAAIGGWLGSKGGESVGESVGNSVGKAIADKPVVATTAAKASASSSQPAAPPPPPLKDGNLETPASIAAAMKAGAVASPAPKPAATSAPVASASKPATASASTAAPSSTPVAMGNEGRRGAKPPTQPPEGSEDKTASAKAVDLGKILKFGTGSGSKENFEGLDPTFKEAVIAAATEYNSVTGNMIMINSAKRASEDQQRLYDETVAAGRPGKGPTGMAVGKPGRSLHEKGHAVDIQNYKDSAAVAAFNKQGLSQKVPNDPVHFQASDGAMVSGPPSGYPVEATFHGPEIVAPLDPDSILTKLSKMSASEMEKPTPISTSSSSTTENIISSNAEMIDLMKMFVEKMDDFIDAQSDSNSIQNELLQYSKV